MTDDELDAVVPHVVPHTGGLLQNRGLDVEQRVGLGIGVQDAGDLELGIDADLADKGMNLRPRKPVARRQHPRGLVGADRDPSEQGGRRIVDLRGEVAQRVNLKFAPDIRFRVDDRFDQAERIEKLLRTPAVQKDLAPDSDKSS